MYLKTFVYWPQANDALCWYKSIHVYTDVE